MIHFDVITIFPEFFRGPFDYGVIRRGREKGLLETRVHDLRTFTSDRHHTVDDRPFEWQQLPERLASPRRDVVEQGERPGLPLHRHCTAPRPRR